MPQIFKPVANNQARFGVVVFGLAPWVIMLSLAMFSRSPFNTKVEVPRNQPVPFSHRHHAWELGIDCRYCHTGVEKGPFAGIPGTETCMSCHSQIWTNSPLLEPIRESYETGTPIRWTRVNKVPEFVFFNHSIHISRGINCNVCHGAVEQMPITWKGKAFEMSWCLDCHRDPAKHLYADAPDTEHPGSMTPRQQVFELYWKIQNGEELTDREKSLARGEEYSPTPQEYADGQKLVNLYGVKVAELSDCTTCHR